MHQKACYNQAHSSHTRRMVSEAQTEMPIEKDLLYKRRVRRFCLQMAHPSSYWAAMVI